ncbi:MAG TPA: ribosome-associated translation inhibitor RaiA [Thiothrix sp.]|nr:ribosome-associated translation inhibitor RaiA [Thiothrix sp.]
MKIDIQTQNFSLTPAIKKHINQHCGTMIHHFSNHIINVHIHLSDINGSKRGKDKRCLVHIELHRLPTIIIENTEHDLYNAINKASHRAQRAVRKALERKQTRERHSYTPAVHSY